MRNERSAISREIKQRLIGMASHGNLTGLTAFLEEERVDVNYLDESWGMTLLMRVVSIKNYKAVETILQLPQVNINEQNREGMTALMYAAIYENEDIIRLLRQSPLINPNVQDVNGMTALMHAKSIIGVALLLRIPGSNLDIQDTSGMTALMREVMKIRPHHVASILKHRRIDPTATDHDGKRALILAINNGHMEIVHLFLSRGVTFSLDEVQDIAQSGHAALVYTLFLSFPPERAAAFLQERGIDINARNEQGRTALMAAASLRDGQELVKTLLQAGADPNIISHDGERTALTIAIERGRIDTVEALIKRGARLSAPQVVNINRRMALICAALSAFPKNEALFFLQQLGISNISDAGHNGETPLARAAKEGDSTALSLLLEAKANPNVIVSSSKISPLMHAAISGNLLVAQLLLKAGADPNSLPYNGMSAVITALKNGHLEVAELLLNNGAVITRAQPAFFVFETFRHSLDVETACTILQQANIDINATDTSEITALMVAALTNQPHIVRALLAAGAEINMVDLEGRTALTYAMVRGNTEIIELLLASAANFEALMTSDLEFRHSQREDVVAAVDRIVLYASMRREPGFFNHLITIGRNFISDGVVLAIVAGAMSSEDKRTTELLSWCDLNFPENHLKIAKIRDLKSALMQQLTAKNYPNPEEAARILTITFASNPEMMKAVRRLKEFYSAFPNLDEDIKDKIFENFIVRSPLDLSGANPAPALRKALNEMLWDGRSMREAMRKAEAQAKSDKEAEEKESKDESGAKEEKSPLPKKAPPSIISAPTAEQLQRRSESKRYDDERIEPESPYR